MNEQNTVIEANFKLVQDRTPEIIAAEIQMIEAQVTQTVIAGAIKIGERLEEAKAKVGHGNFEKWCEENLNYSKSKAERFMKICTEYGKENSAYFDAISKTAISTDLSIYKALALLKVDEDEVLEFAENTKINELTVKELEEEIRKLKAENNDLEKLKVKTERLEKDLKTAEAEKEELKELFSEIENNTVNSDSESEGLREELEKKEDEIRKLSEKLEKAKAKEEQLKNERAAIEAQTVEAIEKAKAEMLEDAAEKAKAAAEIESREAIAKINAELEAALKRAAEAEKKMHLTNNEEIVAFKIKTEQLQNICIEINTEIENIRKNDVSKAEAMRGAFKKLLETLSLRIQ